MNDDIIMPMAMAQAAFNTQGNAGGGGGCIICKKPVWRIQSEPEEPKLCSDCIRTAMFTYVKIKTSILT